jgi:hypothetical protein
MIVWRPFLRRLATTHLEGGEFQQLAVRRCIPLLWPALRPALRLPLTSRRFGTMDVSPSEGGVADGVELQLKNRLAESRSPYV